MEFILSYFWANEKGEEMELGGRIATASVRTGFAMTGFLQGVRWYAKRSGILLEYRSFYTLYFLLFQFVMRT